MEQSSPRKNYFFVLLAIFLLSLIPVFHTWGRLQIGGDIMIPFNLAGLNKYLFQWLNTQNGAYFSQNYFPLYLLYGIASYFRFSIYETSSLIYLLINLVGGLGIYKITEILSGKSHRKFIGLLSVLFYLLSPALFNAWHYLYIYSVVPWFVYFLLKFVISKRLTFGDLIWLQVVVFFSTLDLPNPKYLFYLFVCVAVIFIGGMFTGMLEFKTIKSNGWKIALLFGMNAYLILPLLYFSMHYRPADYGVRVKAGYSDLGKMMDTGVSTADKMLTLHHGANFDEVKSQKYLENPSVIIFSYLIVFIIFLDVFLIKRKSKYYKIKLTLLPLIVIFLYLAIGPNPPFGFLYESIVTKIKLFAFLRTTAGAVFFLSLLYSIYLYLALEEHARHKKLILVTILGSILLLGYPILSGSYFDNVSKTNSTLGQRSRGYQIPNEYLEVSDSLNAQKLVQRTYIPGADSSYIRTNWGYFGPPIYYFLYDNYPIFKDSIYQDAKMHNIGNVFLDKNLFNPSKPYPSYTSRVVTEVGSVSIFETERKLFKPILQAHSESSSDLTLEFKKINPTKFRLRVHKAIGDLKLTLLESYNKGWTLTSQPLRNEWSSSIGQKETAEYKILEKNETDQATQTELLDFISKGYITTLGDYKTKEITHRDWAGGREFVSRVENYHIDFISKKYENAIQNDNLKVGNFYETWFHEPKSVTEKDQENEYANTWNIDIDKFCSIQNECIKNKDGSYDFELIIEFWPQQIFNLSVLISAIMAATCLVLGITESREKS